ncbi:MAG: GNAT family N-acetyltransferase [Candidatus Nanopelagicales bacterium]
MPLVIEARDYGDPEVVALVADLQQEFVRRYGGEDETAVDDDHFAPPSGAFFVGLLDGTPVAMGGWRLRPDVSALGGGLAAEVKRMYVVPPQQRRGFARAVLAHLEGTARAAGADVMVLETGLEQPEAIALYESCGYQPVPGFGHYRDSPLSRCLGRRLDT